MRTIKFRGKRIGNGEWVYGDLLQGVSGDVYIVITHENGVTKYEVQNETIGQFTGLHDKNGKEIYEGDVIIGKYETKHLIQYNEKEGSCFAYRLPISEFSFKGHFNQDWVNACSKIVIGNIHDNPELKKGGKNK